MTICIHCQKSEEQVPLLQMRYRGSEICICPQCLPVLIHKPEKLAGELPGLEISIPVEHEHQDEH
jgi:recombinational DNA repair protein (RecF pathway)